MNKFKASIHRSTISRLAKSINKTVDKKQWCVRFMSLVSDLCAVENSQPFRDQYQAELANYTAQQLVFVDKSAANEHTEDWKYAWTPTVRPRKSKIAQLPQQQFIFPAYTITGF